MVTQRDPASGGWAGFRGANGDDTAANVAATDLINILDAVEVPVVVLRRDFTIACFNKAGADILGLSSSDIGRASRDIPVLGTLSNLEQLCGSVITDGLISRANFRLGEKWFVVRMAPYTKVDRQLTGIVLTFNDVTAFRASIDQAIYERECTKSMLNTVADPLVVLSADLRIQTGNSAFYTMFGVSRDETQGVPLSELGHRVFEHSSLGDQLKETLAVRPAFEPVEVDHVFTVMGERTLMLNVHPLSFPGHSERRVLVTFQDITARKQAEAGLRELNDTLEKQVRTGEEFHRVIVETANDAVVTINHRGYILIVNHATTTTFGYEPSELIGQPLTILMPEYLRDLHEAGLKRYQETNHRHMNWQSTELIGLRKNGEEFPVEVSFGEVTKNGHRVFTGFIRDISGRKQAEETLRASERDLSSIIETIPGLVWCAAPDGELNYLNRRILDYTGKNSDAFAQLGWTNFLHPDDVEPTVSVWSRAVTTSQPYDTQCRLRRSDGVYRWFQALGEAARDDKGGVTRWYGLLIDIDDRKNMEEALRSNEARLARATRTATLGEFAASIAHEINQPLAAVVANGHACLRWLSAQPPGLAKAQEAAERIVRDGTESGEVVRRIRALFKHAPLDKIDLDLNEVIAEVLRLLSGERMRRQISVETDLDKDLGPVVGDRVQLQQVVFNLLLNGIEAMDSVLDDPKKLFIRSKRQSPETVLVEIRDSGVGLKDPEKVFEAFFTTKENGMGMGLAVCRSIIDAHHGRLWASSAEGAGTTFSFTVPAAAVTAATLQVAS